MPVFAFTAGSFGDILATAGLAAQVAQVFYDNRNITEECDSLSIELQFLQRVLLLTNEALQRYESTPLGIPLIHSIRPEVAQCHKILKKCSDDIYSCKQSLMTTNFRSLWRKFTWAVTDEPAVLRAKLSSHRLNLALVLISMNTVGLLDVQKTRLGVFTDAQWSQSVNPSFTKRISNDTISVVDQLGDTIPIPTLFCTSWESFCFVLKGYSRNRIGQEYIERGDFQIISSESNEVVQPSAFGRVVLGDILEISIVLMLQTTGEKEQERKCPKCSHVNTTPSLDAGWVQCFRCSGRFKIDSQQSSDSGLEEPRNYSSDTDDEIDLAEANGVSQSRKLAQGQNDISEAKFFRRLTLQLLFRTSAEKRLAVGQPLMEYPFFPLPYASSSSQTLVGNSREEVQSQRNPYRSDYLPTFSGGIIGSAPSIGMSMVQKRKEKQGWILWAKNKVGWS